METYQIVCFILAFLAFSAYWLWVYVYFGIQSSISNSFYIIWKRRPDKPNLRWWFTGSLWGFSIPLAIVGVEIHPIFWGAAALIMFVGAAPAFKSTKIQNNVHMVGSIGGIALALIGFLILGQFVTFILMGGTMLVLTIKRVPNTTWWVETTAFLGTYFGLLFMHTLL